MSPSLVGIRHILHVLRLRLCGRDFRSRSAETGMELGEGRGQQQIHRSLALALHIRLGFRSRLLNA